MNYHPRLLNQLFENPKFSSDEKSIPYNHQGDVLIFRVKGTPNEREQNDLHKEGVIVLGEGSGHAYQAVDMDRVVYFGR